MSTHFKDKVERYLFRKSRQILAKRGYYLSKATSAKEVQHFIKTIKPYSTDKGLIRLGAATDGGYLVPDDLQQIEACFSPGVGAKSKFEEDCLNYGMKTFLADASVENLPSVNDKLHFTKKYLGAYNNDLFMTLDHWAESANLKANSDLLLQMDIEGAEFEVITNTSDKLLQRFRIIVMEVHFLDRLVGVDFHKTASTMFNKLSLYHTCVHIHPNNTDVVHKINGVEILPTIEITFLRNDRIQTKTPAATFPHALDADNTKRQKVVLPTNWYQN